MDERGRAWVEPGRNGPSRFGHMVVAGLVAAGSFTATHPSGMVARWLVVRAPVVQRWQLVPPGSQGTGFTASRVFPEHRGDWVIADQGAVWWVPRHDRMGRRLWTLNVHSAARTPSGIDWVVGSRGNRIVLARLSPNGAVRIMPWPLPYVEWWKGRGIEGASTPGPATQVAWAGGHLWAMGVVRTARFGFYRPVIAMITPGGRAQDPWTVPLVGGAFTALTGGDHGGLWIGGNTGAWFGENGSYRGNAELVALNPVRHTVKAHVSAPSMGYDGSGPNEDTPDTVVVRGNTVWTGLVWFQEAQGGPDPHTLWSLNPISGAWTQHALAPANNRVGFRATAWTAAAGGRIGAAVYIADAVAGVAAQRDPVWGEVFWDRHVVAVLHSGGVALGVNLLGGGRLAMTVAHEGPRGSINSVQVIVVRVRRES